MTNLEAKLRIRAETGQAEGALAKVRGGVQSISEQLQSLRNQALTIFGVQGGVQAIRTLAELADGYVGLAGRLRLATRGDAEFRQSLALTRDLARQYQQPLRETATLYTRLLSAVRPLGGGTREAGVATQALLASLKITGATASESASALLQFSQALGSGALRGEEFNAIAEAAPALLDALARGLGRPKDELKALAEQGALTTSAVVGALGKELPRLQRDAAAVGQTIGGAAQQVRDSFFEMVGASAEGSKGIASVVSLLKLLADNLPAVVKAVGLLVAGIAALKLAVFANGLVAAGAAAATGATGITAFGLAARGALAFITGPVGWIVALASLAAAWVGLRTAQEKAVPATVNSLRSQRKDIEAELARYRSEAESPQFRTANLSKIGDAERRLKGVNEQLVDMRQHERELAEISTQDSAARVNNLLDPKTTREFEDKNKGRAALEKELADERARYVVAKDKAILAARAAGDEKLEGQLLANKRASLAEFDRQRKETLGKFDSRDQLTRVAQAQALYSRERELLADAIERETAINQTRYERGITDLASYLARREQLEDSAHDLKVRQLGDELAAEQKARRLNEGTLARTVKPNDRAQLQDTITKSVAREAELQVEITKALRDQADAERVRNQLQTDKAGELLRLRQRVADEIADASGRDLTPNEIRTRALERLKEDFKRVASGGDQQGEDALLQLVDVQATQAQLAQVERDFARTQQKLAAQEQAIRQQVEAGTLVQTDGERQILDLRREQVPVLDAILARLEALASTPQDKQRIEQLRLQIGGLRDFRGELEKTARSAATSGLTQALNDIITGAKSGKDALLDMVSGFAKAMLNVLNQRLAEKLVDSFLSAIGGTGGGGGGGFLASIGKFFAGLFHSGGVVGAGGGVRRAVNPAVFAFAPRYHAGGIAGLRRNEVPAILEEGEEVLTTDNPRHIRNAGRVGGVSYASNTTVTGAAGGQEQLRNAGDDLERRQRASFDSWLLDQMRPGGVLARG